MCVMFLFDQSFVYFYSKVVDILLSRAPPHWHCVICSFIKSQSRLRRRREKKGADKKCMRFENEAIMYVCVSLWWLFVFCEFTWVEEE